MDEEGRAYEAGYEQGFIDGAQKNAEFKVTKFIEQNMRKPLTDDQIEKLFIEEVNRPAANWIRFARAVEQAHGIKND